MSFRVSTICILLCTASPLPAMPVNGAPAAKIVPFGEQVQGIAINDPYRWMESGGAEYDAVDDPHRCRDRLLPCREGGRRCG